MQGGPKRHKIYDTIILQPYVIESCGFQHNVPKEILYVTKVNKPYVNTAVKHSLKPVFSTNYVC